MECIAGDEVCCQITCYRHTFQLLRDTDGHSYFIRHTHPNGAILEFDFAGTDFVESYIAFGKWQSEEVKKLDKAG